MATTPLGSWRRVLYALGNAGFLISDRVVAMLAVYYYLPPPGRGLAPRVAEAPLLGIFTAFGLAMLIARSFEAISDPLVGFASDRSRSRWGRRRVFLLGGLLPMCLLPVLLFFPPAPGAATLNSVWLVVLLSLYFVSFTAYVGPYFSLLPEVAWDDAERLRLAQWMSLLSLPVMGALTAWGIGLEAGRSAGLSTESALRVMVIAFAALALLLCLGPILAVDESSHARGERSELSFRAALVETLRDRAFRRYLLASVFWIIALGMLQPAMPYFVTAVMGRSEGFTLQFMLATGLGLALGFRLQAPLLERYAPKRLVLVSLVLIALSLALLGGLRPGPAGGVWDRWNLVLSSISFTLFGAAASGFMVLPQILIGQLIDADAQRTGASRSAMYYGVQGLTTKWAYGSSTWILTWLLARFGNSPERPWGVVLIGPVSALFALVALAIFATYRAPVAARTPVEAPVDGAG